MRGVAAPKERRAYESVAKAFPDASSVNRALRLLLELAKKQLSKRSA
jgi:hypothetical protein